MSEWMRTEHKSGPEFDSYQLCLTHWLLHIYAADTKQQLLQRHGI